MKTQLKTRLFAVLPVIFALVGCGGVEGVGVTLSMSQALQPEIENITLLVFADGVTCVGLDADPETTLSWQGCDTADELRCVHDRIGFPIDRTEEDLVIFVPVGRRFIYGAGFDADDRVIATGCNGPLDIEEGKNTAIRMTLD